MPSTDIYPLSLHDALPIFCPRLVLDPHLRQPLELLRQVPVAVAEELHRGRQQHRPHDCRVDQDRHGQPDAHLLQEQDAKRAEEDRKSTRLNSSHQINSYAVHRYLPSFPTRRSSDLLPAARARPAPSAATGAASAGTSCGRRGASSWPAAAPPSRLSRRSGPPRPARRPSPSGTGRQASRRRSEEHTSELQSPDQLVCRPPISTLFPYTTLFRSSARGSCSTRTFGSHWSCFGRYQLRSPRSFIVAGSSTALTTVASIRTATASPTPISFRNRTPSEPKKIGRAHV